MKRDKKEKGGNAQRMVSNRNFRGVRGIYTDPKVSQFSTEIDRNPIRRKEIRGALTMIKLDARLYVDTRYLRLFILGSSSRPPPQILLFALSRLDAKTIALKRKYFHVVSSNAPVSLRPPSIFDTSSQNPRNMGQRNEIPRCYRIETISLLFLRDKPVAGGGVSFFLLLLLLFPLFSRATLIARVVGRKPLRRGNRTNFFVLFNNDRSTVNDFVYRLNN